MALNISAHKQIATNFLQLATHGQVERAFQNTTSGFRHHNPYFAGDAASLSKAMAENARQNPHKVFEIQHVVEEADLVVVHGRVRLQPDSVDIALVHIFRFEGDAIAELWDISHAMPANSPNKFGMF